MNWVKKTHDLNKHIFKFDIKYNIDSAALRLWW